MRGALLNLQSKWIVILCCCQFLGGCDSTCFRSYYATYAEAQASGAVAKGWIPDFVPKTATEICEVHDLDSNTQQMAFSFTLADGKYMVSNLTPIISSSLKFPDIEEPWWPKSAVGFDFYEYHGNAEQKSYLAVDWIRCRAFFWSELRGE